VKSGIWLFSVIIIAICSIIYYSPMTVSPSDNIKSFDFNGYYNSLIKSISNNQEARVTEFFLMFNDQGKIMDFRFKLSVNSNGIVDVYYFKFHPNLKVTTMSHSKANYETKELTGRRLFQVLNNIELTRVINKENRSPYTLLSTLEYKERKYNEDQDSDVFVIENGELINLNLEQIEIYPKSFELMLYGNNHLLERYIFENNS